MIDVLVSLIGEALIAVAGPAATAVRTRWRSRTKQTLGIPDLSPDARSTLTRVVAWREFNQATTIALSKFVTSPEGRLLARYISVNVLTEGTARADAEIQRQAIALLRLSTHTSHLDAEQLAPDVVRVLAVTTQMRVLELERKSPRLHESLRQIAYQEYSSDLFRRLRESGRDLDSLAGYDPSLLYAAVECYCTDIAQRFSLVPIPSLQEERRVPLDLIYVEPSTLKLGSSGTGVGLTEPAGVTELLRLSSHWVVLGDPGGGKSTLLKATVHMLAESFSKKKELVLPLFVSLAAYSRSSWLDRSDLLSYVQSTIPESLHPGLDLSALRYLCATGRVILLLDGLDEILTVATRADVRDHVEALAARFPGVAIIVSSRTNGYGEAPLNAGRFRRIELAGFDEARVSEFVSAFFQIEGAEDTLVSRFMHDSVASSDIRSNPLMLGLLCILYLNDRTIPSNRSELYRSCAELLFSKWDSRRGIEPKVGDPEVAEDAVCSIALSVFSEQLDEIPESWLRTHLAGFYARERSPRPAACNAFATEVIDLWRGRRWLLVRIGSREGEDCFTFAHRTFLEYFAALQTVYNSIDLDALWSTLEPYVRTRSGVVYSQLVAEMFSRRFQSAGDQLLRRLVDRVRAWPARYGWNGILFTSEVLLSMRASADARRTACHLLVDTICSLMVLNSDFPSSAQVYDDVFDQLAPSAGEADSQPGSNDFAGNGGGEFDDEDRATYSFATLTMPLQSLAKATGAVREELLDSAGERVLELCADAMHNPHAVKLAMELPVFRYLETWQELDEGRGSYFERWATSLWSRCRDALLGSDIPFGRDYWLDVYLARDGMIPLMTLYQERGPLAFLLGDWGLPLISSPAVGTCLHTLVLDAVVRTLSRSESRECIVIGPAIWQAFREDIDPLPYDAGGLEVLFSARPALLSALLEPARVLPLTEVSAVHTFGLTCALMSLAMAGDFGPVDELGSLSGDRTLLKILAIVNSVRYTGEKILAYDEAEQLFGDRAHELRF